MRNKDDLMRYLNHLRTDDESLTEAELERLTQTVLKRTGLKKTSRKRKNNRARLIWSRVLVSGAACAVFLVGMNGINPAFAEGVPFLGDVFAYINGLSKTPLRSEQLTEYAQPAQLQAESGPEAVADGVPKVAAARQDAVAEQPYTLTLSQVYCDELYLRVGLVLTASDDSLAGFDALTIDPPLLYEDTTEAEANTLYGGVTLNGESVGSDLLPYFRKQDDHTFFCEMDYSLADYTGSTQDMQASLTLSYLVGVNAGDGAVGSEEQTPLEGSYGLNFTVSADTSLTRVGQVEDGEQNGVRLSSVKVTPGETQTEYVVTESWPVDATPALRVYAVEDGEWTKLQPASGKKRQDDAQSCTVYTDYFDAVPEGVTELCVQMLDKNAAEEVILAEWTVTLP